MDTLSFYIFSYFTESFLKGASPPLFIFDVAYQTVFNIFGTPQLSVASIYGFPNAAPILTHSAVVVTHPTLWWCTSIQDPCHPLKFLTLDPTDINTYVLSLLIPPPHNCLTKLGLSGTKTRNLVNC